MSGNSWSISVEVLAADPDDLDVVERRAGGGAHAARPAGRSRRSSRGGPGTRSTSSPPGKALRDLHEAEPDQVEAVGRVALPEDHLARLVAQQLDAVAQPPHEVVAEAGQHRHAPQVRLERALAVASGRARPGTSCSSAGCASTLRSISRTTRLLDRAHRRRARIEAHARHLAEEVARRRAGRSACRRARSTGASIGMKRRRAPPRVGSGRLVTSSVSMLKQPLRPRPSPARAAE